MYDRENRRDAEGPSAPTPEEIKAEQESKKAREFSGILVLVLVLIVPGGASNNFSPGHRRRAGALIAWKTTT